MPLRHLSKILLLALPAIAHASPQNDPWHAKARALLEHALAVLLLEPEECLRVHVHDCLL